LEFDCDVLIVGAGPTGLTLAILLAQRGVNVIVAEKEAAPYLLPRAAHIDHEGMRILQEAGAADEVFAGSRGVTRYDFLNGGRKLLMRFEGADRIADGGWPGANMIHQPSVEAALRRSLARQPTARLHHLWEVLSFEDSGADVTAHIKTPGGLSKVHARFLVGADGAKSPVREIAGIPSEDLRFEEPWLVVDVLVEDPARLPSGNLQICDPKRPTTCVMMGKGRHRWEFMILKGETAEQVSRDAYIEKLLEPWDVKGAIRIERSAVYTFRARIAEKWRCGNIFLAGDAAHQMPPFAGQGMCSGLRDAANLAWKLAAVIKDGASRELLDTYQPEREPNLRAIIDTAIMMGRMVCTTNWLLAKTRDIKFAIGRALGKLPRGPSAYPPILEGAILAGSTGAGSYFPQPVAADGARLDDALGPRHWILTRDDFSRPSLAPFASKIARWLDDRNADAVLVRPDRYVFGTGRADELSRAWDHVAGIKHVKQELLQKHTSERRQG
jgi:3-(3-hydroxy-phenyl)propionate hydroxylase